MKQNSTKKILICEFHQETNTFNPIPDGWECFRAGRYMEGQEICDICKDIPCAVHGAMDAIAKAGGTVYPTFALYGTYGGRVKDEVLETFLEKVRTYAEKEPDFDGIYASLHGATCTAGVDDACGEILAMLRELAGDRPIVASCDLHGNITEKMYTNADIICGYQTYPHVDFYESGYRAASLCMRILAGEPTVMATTTIPMMVPPAGYSSLEGAFKEVIDMGKGMIADGVLLDFSTFQVQPWLDIDNIGSTVIAIAADADTAKAKADELAQALFARREQYWPDLMTIDEVIDLTEKDTTPKPVILADSADSTNGGAVGDGIAVALRLLERGSHLRAGMYIKDPEAARQAFAVGVGNSAEFTIGAKFTPGVPGPLKAVGTVRSLHDGHFRNEGPAGKGFPYYVGPAAVISVGNIDIMVCDAPKSSGDPQLLRHFGIEPTLYDLIVVKANTSFRAPYSKFAGEICYADTPGAGSSNLLSLQWHNIPKGFYPFDLPEGYTPAPAEVRSQH